MKQTQYDVFISYSRKDYVDEQKNIIPGNEVSKIKDALSEAGITYWFDEEGIYSGQNFIEKIVTNIENAKIFLFLSTANSNKSPWTCKEIASADEFKKHIIPVRIDSSPYNKKVLFRIADLDYIEYYNNPQKGIEYITKSIKAYLEDLAKAQKLKEEEENKKKELERKREEDKKRQNEQDEKRRLEEQQKIVKEITLKCTALRNEESKIELDRATLVLSTEKVTDEKERASLISLIQESSPIQKKVLAENMKLKKENEDYKEQISSITDQRDRALVSLNEKKGEIEELNNKEKSLQTEMERLNLELQDTSVAFKQLKNKSETISLINLTKSNKRLKVGVIILAFFSLFLSIKILVNGRESLESREKMDSINKSAQLKQSNNSSTEIVNETTLRAIDLGLSVKWANMNVGAKSTCEIGSYFAWGEVSPKKDYNKATYVHLKEGRYTLIGEKGEDKNGKFYYNIGATEFDAAYQNMGREWRMPTESECKELIENCDWIWDSSKSGYIVRGRKVKNSIFLPITGCMAGKGVSLNNAKRKSGFYWSSKTANTQHYDNGESASALQFSPYSSNGIVVSPIDRVPGRCIRAVRE